MAVFAGIRALPEVETSARLWDQAQQGLEHGRCLLEDADWSRFGCSCAEEFLYNELIASFDKAELDRIMSATGAP